jgi:hypothetical protein
MANKNPNMDGLKKYTEMTAEEKREFHSRGGTASTEKRREQASIRKAVQLFLSLSITDPRVKEQLKKLGVDVKKLTNVMLPTLGLFKRACKGDPAAARLLAELNGENQVQGTTNIDSEGVKFNISFTGKGGNDADT